MKVLAIAIALVAFAGSALADTVCYRQSDGSVRCYDTHSGGPRGFCRHCD